MPSTSASPPPRASAVSTLPRSPSLLPLLPTPLPTASPPLSIACFFTHVPGVCLSLTPFGGSTGLCKRNQHHSALHWNLRTSKGTAFGDSFLHCLSSDLCDHLMIEKAFRACPYKFVLRVRGSFWRLQLDVRQTWFKSWDSQFAETLLECGFVLV